jgi:tetratricopeptide (TPR) repeat protein
MAIPLNARLIFFLGASFALSLGAASAEDDDITLCNGGADISPEARIAGCTGFIGWGTESDENLAAAYNNRGNAYDDSNQPDLAIKDYERAMELAPEDATAYFNRGVTYYNKGDNSRAMPDFDEAIRLRPDYAKALTARGELKVSLGDVAGGNADLEAAKALTP